VKTEREYPHPPIHSTPEQELHWLNHELAEARATIRQLRRQIEREQARYSEISRSYKLTVENLQEIARHNTELEREREIWRTRAGSAPAAPTFGEGSFRLTADEISAIRRAMARLHHPDTGGDAQRMQIWNATLDALEP
jgi:chromosome segregation ATPase